MLIVFGWRLYEIRYSFPGDDTDYVGRAFSKQSLEPDTRVKQIVVHDIMIVHPTTANGEN